MVVTLPKDSEEKETLAVDEEDASRSVLRPQGGSAYGPPGMHSLAYGAPAGPVYHAAMPGLPPPPPPPSPLPTSLPGGAYGGGRRSTTSTRTTAAAPTTTTPTGQVDPPPAIARKLDEMFALDAGACQLSAGTASAGKELLYDPDIDVKLTRDTEGEDDQLRTSKLSVISRSLGLRLEITPDSVVLNGGVQLKNAWSTELQHGAQLKVMVAADRIVILVWNTSGYYFVLRVTKAADNCLSHHVEVGI